MQPYYTKPRGTWKRVCAVLSWVVSAWFTFSAISILLAGMSGQANDRGPYLLIYSVLVALVTGALGFVLWFLRR
jgi:hypothetical protein